MSRRHKRSWQLTIAPTAMDEVAAGLNEHHAADIAGGMRLCRSSGIWRRKDGTVTVRLVYRSRGHTRVHTFYGLRLER